MTKKKKTLHFSSILKGILILAIAFIIIMPFYWLLMISLKTQPDAFSGKLQLIFKPNFEHYIKLFKDGSFMHYFKNSFIITTGSVILSLVIGVPAAYVFARMNFKGSKLIFNILLITRMSPGAVFVIPYFFAYQKIGALDTKVGLMIIYFALNLGVVVWMMRPFIEDIPVSLEESAQIEGCSMMGAFFKIVLPLVRPGILATAIMTFIFSWNEFLLALLITRREAMTAPIGLLNFMVFERVDWGPIAAGSIIISVPVLLFGVLMRKHFVKGLAQGALGGD